MSVQKPLVLNISDLTAKVYNFYHKMDTSKTYRDRFLLDPMETLSKDIPRGTFSKGAIRLSKTNRLLFELLSNKKFMEWTKGFERDIESKINATLTANESTKAQMELASYLNQNYFYCEIAHAMFECIDLETFQSLFKRPLDPTIRSVEDLTLSEDSPVTAVSDPLLINQLKHYAQTEILLLFVVAVFVFVAYTDVMIQSPDLMSRTDLRRISNIMIKELTKRANLLPR